MMGEMLLGGSIVTALCVYVLATTLPDVAVNVRRDGLRVGLVGRGQIATTLTAAWTAIGTAVGAVVVALAW
jgi:hypothetical protein